MSISRESSKSHPCALFEALELSIEGITPALLEPFMRSLVTLIYVVISNKIPDSRLDEVSILEIIALRESSHDVDYISS